MHGSDIEALRALLRRDPTDRDLAFLISLVAREPLVVYPGERSRLRQLSEVRDTTHRGGALRAVARALLAGATPSRGLRRPGVAGGGTGSSPTDLE